MKPWDEEFEKILMETQSKIRAYIAGFGVPYHQIDDIAQDVYMVYYENPTKKPNNVLSIAWLKGISKTLCLKFFRESKQEKCVRDKLTTIANMLENTGPVLHEKEESLVGISLQNCLSKLSERNQKMLNLKYCDGVSYKRLGELFDGNTQSIGMHLLRIKKKVINCLNKQMAT